MFDEYHAEVEEFARTRVYRETLAMLEADAILEDTMHDASTDETLLDDYNDYDDYKEDHYDHYADYDR